MAQEVPDSVALTGVSEKRMEIYRSLLVEIKYRIEAIDLALQMKCPLRPKIVEELGYLQLRMICEVIAIGCLTIHGNLSVTSRLLTTYKADWIISELAKLHPKFFPVALENKDAPGDIPKMVHKKEGFLTQQELSSLWNKHAGSHLHRGSARNLLLKNKRALNFPEIWSWRNKIVQLLDRHIILSPDEKYMYHFSMGQEIDKVSSTVFRAVADSGHKPKALS